MCIQSQDINKQLLATSDQREVDNILNKLNTQIKKKEAIRASTYSELQDKVTQEIKDRLDARSGEFSNKELLDCLTTFDNIVSKNKVEKIEVPQIAIQQNINIDGSDLNVDSRQKIQKYIQNILSGMETLDGTENNNN